MDNNHTPEPESTFENESTNVRTDIAETRNDSKVLQAQVRAEKKARQHAEKKLTDAQEALSVAKAKLEKERLEREQAQQELIETQALLEKIRIEADELRQVKDNAEPEKTEADNALEYVANTSFNEDEASTSSELYDSEQRISFVIRLAVDKRGQTRRTQIEHALSGNKDVFPSFNVQRMVDFIESTVATIVSGEGAEALIQTETLPEEKTEKKNLELSLAITDLQTICINDKGELALIFIANTPISVRTYIQISGTESLAGFNCSIPYKINIYAIGVDTRSSSLVATGTADLVPGISVYSSQMQISGLPAGIFRLGIISIIPSPVNIAKITQETLLQVFEP
jgi:hypothetical protein